MVVGSPPLVLEALFMAQVLQSAQNEARVAGAEAFFALSKDQRRD